MVHSASRIPNFLWHPKVHYRVHKSLLLVPVLKRMNTIHTLPSYLSKTYFNIYTYVFWAVSSFQFPNQNVVDNYNHPTCIAFLIHLILLDLTILMKCAVQIIEHFIMQIFSSFKHLGPNMSSVPSICVVP